MGEIALSSGCKTVDATRPNASQPWPSPERRLRADITLPMDTSWPASAKAEERAPRERPTPTPPVAPIAPGRTSALTPAFANGLQPLLSRAFLRPLFRQLQPVHLQCLLQHQLANRIV